MIDIKKNMWVIALLLLPVLLHATVTFQRYYDRDATQDIASSVIQTADEGFVMSGYTYVRDVSEQYDYYLVKTDSWGDVIWTQTFPGGVDFAYAPHSMQQTSDGGFIIIGSTSLYGAVGMDIYLIKTDADGNIEWDTTYGGDGEDRGSSVQQTSDGGFILTGYTSSFGPGPYNIFLMKTDLARGVEWARVYGGTSMDMAYSVRQTLDGGYIITGFTFSYGQGGDVYLVKTDSLGNTEWETTYGGAAVDEGRSIQQTPDKGYIITGSTQSFGAGNSDIYLIKIDSLGNVEWDTTYGDIEDDYGRCVQQTSDGGYMIVGSWNDMSFSSEISLIKTDDMGNSEWIRTYGESNIDRGQCGLPTMDGGYVLTGIGNGAYGSTDTIAGDFYLIKTDSLGYAYAPIIWVSPGSFTVNLQSGSTTERTLKIGNDGLGDLYWDVSEMYGATWISEDPVNGMTYPNDTTEVTLYFDASGLAPGDYYDTLLVSNNDLTQPMIEVGVRLHVIPGAIEEGSVTTLEDRCELLSSVFNKEITLGFTKPSNTPLEIALYNILGARVYDLLLSSTPGSIVLNDKKISSLSGGVYFLSILKGKEVYPVKKVIKIEF